MKMGTKVLQIYDTFFPLQSKGCSVYFLGCNVYYFNSKIRLPVENDNNF